MSFGIPTGESREENSPQFTDFGPGFSTIDINTVIGNTRTTLSSSIITSVSLSTPAETTTLATVTQSRPLNRIDASSSSLISTILEDTQSTSTRSIPTTQPPLVTSPPSLPTFPTLVMATDAQGTAEVTRTEMSVPTTSNNSENNTASTQPTEATSPRISTGGAVGITIVVVVVVVLLGFGIFRYLKQRKLQGLPPPKSKRGSSAQMAAMPYMGNERSLEEGWEAESTTTPYPFDPHASGLGLGLSGVGDQRHSMYSNPSITRLPIHR
ncbi:hypothetical protein TWF281_001009 [Arthrobotrys megalospora]